MRQLNRCGEIQRGNQKTTRIIVAGVRAVVDSGDARHYRFMFWIGFAAGFFTCAMVVASLVMWFGRHFGA